MILASMSSGHMLDTIEVIKDRLVVMLNLRPRLSQVHWYAWFSIQLIPAYLRYL